MSTLAEVQFRPGLEQGRRVKHWGTQESQDIKESPGSQKKSRWIYKERNKRPANASLAMQANKPTLETVMQ